MPKVTCQSCKISFFKNTSAYNRSVKKEAKHYCNRICSSVGKKVTRKTCPTCGNKTKTAAQRFCSKFCYSENQAGKKRKKPEEYAKVGVSSNKECLATGCTNMTKHYWNHITTYCSSSCSSAHREYTKRQKRLKTCPKCPVCSVPVPQRPSRRKIHCSEKCSSITRKKNSKNSDYRTIAFARLPNKCADCDIDEQVVLEVHHLDKDRKNNQLNNLVILCANCHLRRHRVILNGA